MVAQYYIIAMIRTQIQLTEKQYRALKEEAHRRKLSLSEAVRGAVDLWLGQQRRGETVRRSLASIGRFHSGVSDVSERHDHYLAEAYRGVPEG
jgi:hypothetical protein